jgi:Tol biopolymer transport system component/DNA-binding winged helix-turn-helix (wHTH) protein
MTEPGTTLGSIRFGPFDLSVETGQLRKNGIRLKLTGQPIQVLIRLVAKRGSLVTREELQRELWGSDIFGDPTHGLNAAVNRMREALGDSATEPRYIETVPGRGYRFIAAIESASIQQPQSEELVPSAPPRPETPEQDTKPPGRESWRRKGVVALAACIVFAAALYLLIRPRVDELLRLHQLRQLKEVPVTALPGRVRSPTFSPDGSQIAFIWDGGKPTLGTDLYVKVIGNDKLLRLTQDGDVGGTGAWSPDGRSIAFWRYIPDDECGIFLVSPLGGPARKITSTSCFSTFVGWSTDGRQIVFTDHPAKFQSEVVSRLFVLSLDSLEKNLVETDCDAVQTPVFSPRGDYLAWICQRSATLSSVDVQRLSDGRNTELLHNLDEVLGLSWSTDGRRIIFDTSGDLWEVALAWLNHAERLPLGHDASDLAVSPSRNRLAFTQNRVNVNIWRLDLSDPEAGARKVVGSSRIQVAPNISPDDKQIAFESDRAGSHEVWISDSDGSNAIQLSSFGVRYTGSPHWSSDGKLIAFDSRAGGEANIYIVDPRGGVPRKLDIDLHGNSSPSWSHNGKWIYFVNGDDANNPQVWKVPSKGGHAMPLTGHSSRFPVESPDGRYVYFSRDLRLWRVGTDGAGEQQIQGMPGLASVGVVTPFGSGIYFLTYVNGKAEIDFFDLNTKQARRIFVPEKPLGTWAWIGGLPVSSDGKWLLFPQRDEDTSDVMMIENWK